MYMDTGAPVGVSVDKQRIKRQHSRQHANYLTLDCALDFKHWYKFSKVS